MNRWRRAPVAIMTSLAVAVAAAVLTTTAAAGANYTQITGAGSTWSANAIQQWIADVQQFGMQVNYSPTGSSDGRSQFLQGTVDFAASDIPFQSHPDDGSQPEQPAPGSYAYIPVTAGGTVFAYNLTINGQRVTNLRLSGQNIAKIFTGAITNWNDPAIAADNPQLTMPNRTIVPVVRSDGSGSTAQFTLWMIAQYPNLWNAYCNKSGRAPACGETSYYPTVSGMIAQNGDLGVMGYVAQNYAQGAIGYVNYSYALNAHFPVAKMLNSAGYYTEPTPDNVAVSLLQAQVDTADVNDPSLYLTQQLGGVYTDSDPRAYPLSSYSYLIIPTKVQGQFTTGKGHTLADFMYYAMCQGQQESASLGYSPMPYNLVEDSFTQITKIPGAVAQNINIQSCNNPTFSTTSPNKLADEAPQPQACDKQGSTQCATGTGGDTNPTTLNGGGSSSSSTSSGSSSGGSASGGSSSSGSKSGGSAARGAATRGSAASAASRGTAGGAGVARGTTGGTRATGPSGSVPASTGAASGGANTACDPSTGGCGGSAVGTGTSGGAAGSTGGGTVAQDAAGPVATTTTLPARSGLGTAVFAVLLVALALGLVMAPGLTVLYLRRRP
jgi:phosphate ABC transporter phosphate-binding protein